MYVMLPHKSFDFMWPSRLIYTSLINKEIICYSIRLIRVHHSISNIWIFLLTLLFESRENQHLYKHYNNDGRMPIISLIVIDFPHKLNIWVMNGETWIWYKDVTTVVTNAIYFDLTYFTNSPTKQLMEANNFKGTLLKTLDGKIGNRTGVLVS